MDELSEINYTLGIIAARGIEGNPVTFIEPELPTSKQAVNNDPETAKIRLKKVELVLAALTFVVLFITLVKELK